jgi:hypothetical protein
VALLLGAGACTFHVDPNKGRFACTTDNDCGSGYQCIQQQAGFDGGLCFQIGQCKPEICNGIDDDCDGVVDDGFDLQHDVANCGACGHACDPGNECDGGVCRESNCEDGIDNDHNGLTDCADPNCPGRACSATDAGLNCGTTWTLDAGTPDSGCTSDAGCGPADGGAADAGGTDAGAADSGINDGGLGDGGIGDGGLADGVDAGSCPGGSADAGLCPGFIPSLACVPRETICNDGIDNDGDGLTDCADGDCDGLPCAPGKTCRQRSCQ